MNEVTREPDGAHGDGLSRRAFTRVLGTAAVAGAWREASAVGGGQGTPAGTTPVTGTPASSGANRGGDLVFLSATELAARLRARSVSAREVMQAHLAQIERVNPKVNAIVTLVAERAMADAARADEAIVRGGPVGVLHGLPVAHKDLVETAGIRTTQGSPFYRDAVPTQRCADRHPHPRRRRHHAGQDEHAGVRRRLADLQHGVRRDAQSLRPDQDLRRQQRRRRGGAGLRDGADRRRQRHRRLAAQPGRVLQRRRPAAGAGRVPRDAASWSPLRGAGPDGALGRRRGAVPERAWPDPTTGR